MLITHNGHKCLTVVLGVENPQEFAEIRNDKYIYNFMNILLIIKLLN